MCSHARAIGSCLLCLEADRRVVEVEKPRAPKDTDPVNPDHYKNGKLECVEVIETLGLGYHLGTALKYLWRAGRKGDALTDLRKCRWFIDRAIANLEKVK